MHMYAGARAHTRTGYNCKEPQHPIQRARGQAAPPPRGVKPVPCLGFSAIGHTAVMREAAKHVLRCGALERQSPHIACTISEKECL